MVSCSVHFRISTDTQSFSLQVKIHAASVNNTMKLPPKTACKLVFYDEKTRIEADLNVMQTTLTTAHILLLIADKVLVIEPDSGLV